jgi:uncharacterized MAPEG superfamily protein
MTIAFWCVLVAIMLPYVWFGVANSKAGKLRSNNSARDFFEVAQGIAKRALGAHLNSFESSIGFIAAVLVAHLAHAPQGRIDVLAVLYIVFRVLYGFLYLADKASLRSMAWFAGFVCTVALFFVGL